MRNSSMQHWNKRKGTTITSSKAYEICSQIADLMEIFCSPVLTISVRKFECIQTNQGQRELVRNTEKDAAFIPPVIFFFSLWQMPEC